MSSASSAAGAAATNPLLAVVQAVGLVWPEAAAANGGAAVQSVLLRALLALQSQRAQAYAGFESGFQHYLQAIANQHETDAELRRKRENKQTLQALKASVAASAKPDPSPASSATSTSTSSTAAAAASEKPAAATAPATAAASKQPTAESEPFVSSLVTAGTVYQTLLTSTTTEFARISKNIRLIEATLSGAPPPAAAAPASSAAAAAAATAAPVPQLTLPATAKHWAERIRQLQMCEKTKLEWVSRLLLLHTCSKRSDCRSRCNAAARLICCRLSNARSR
jgi:hypothetical protein